MKESKYNVIFIVYCFPPNKGLKIYLLLRGSYRMPRGAPLSEYVELIQPVKEGQEHGTDVYNLVKYADKIIEHGVWHVVKGASKTLPYHYRMAVEGYRMLVGVSTLIIGCLSPLYLSLMLGLQVAQTKFHIGEGK